MGGLSTLSFCLAQLKWTLRRDGDESSGDCARQLPIELRGGVGHAGLALHLERKQGMCRAAGRPGVFVRAQEPDGIGGEARGLGGAGDLDGRVAGFGSKEGFVQSAGQRGEELLPLHAPAIEAQRAAGFESLLPAVERPGTRRSMSGLRRESRRPRATAEPARPIRVEIAGGARTQPGGVGLSLMRSTQAEGRCSSAGKRWMPR